MTIEFPVVGQVFDYHYLWKWQAVKGETEGRKMRPSCVAVVTANSEGDKIVFIAPVTSKSPGHDRQALVVPTIEAKRAGLDTAIQLWVIVDELNVDYPDQSFAIEARTPRGSFSHAFMNEIVNSIHAIRKRGKLTLSRRD